jgi:hypothetical protein
MVEVGFFPLLSFLIWGRLGEFCRAASWVDVSVIAITALVIGLLMPGMMVMLGYPLTALAILMYGFVHRERHATEASRATVAPPQNPAPTVR